MAGDRRHVGGDTPDRRTGHTRQRRSRERRQGSIGFLDPILYQDGIGSSDYRDIAPIHQGSAPKTFAGSDLGVSGTVDKSVGDLQDNQLWGVPIAGWTTTSGYDATTGWGTPKADQFVAALAAMP
jgi:hypothetical protein